MHPSEESALLKRFFAQYASTLAPTEIWMSVARAIGTASQQGLTNPSAIERLAEMYLSDHSTALLLQDLEGTHEEFLGVVPADDGKEYGVFRRDKTGAGGMPFFAVYLMAGDYVTWGIFRAEYSGIFHKKLRIDVVSQSFEKREIRCSRPESIRHTQGVERLIGSIMQAGLMGRVFPVEFVPAFRLTHWWLPCRRWLHNL